MGFRERGGGPHRLMKGRENGSLNSPCGPGSSTHPTPPNSNGNTGQHQPHSPAPPPQGYICYRCGQKGHWIHACPTNDNPDFEGRPRIKRTTAGIPKSFLQKVKSGKPVDGQNVMVTSNGSFVIAKPKKNLKGLSNVRGIVALPGLVDGVCYECIIYRDEGQKEPNVVETKVYFNTSSSSSSSSTSNNNKAFIIDDERRKQSDDYIQEILKISQAAQLEQDKANENQPTPESGPDGKDAQLNSKPDDESKPQADKAKESSASDPTAAGLSQTDPSSQQKNDSKSLLSDKPNEHNDQSNGKERMRLIMYRGS
ncbi:hypothetical protein PCANC_23995 [Puccinia coronata f. sp. avenae]|uniref:CCHC-type domain-containing protein n=1 Tax=Puccinia coronata f. sp. avenae TaxID=200324 RepID=A0A2N5TSA7_9BASI|nr:hypothetical protein PCANC_23995 [Puccinia coronata f. sp. avenae]